MIQPAVCLVVSPNFISRFNILSFILFFREFYFLSVHIAVILTEAKDLFLYVGRSFEQKRSQDDGFIEHFVRMAKVQFKECFLCVNFQALASLRY
ncbi:hypothetical protein AQULUS_09690 [Aquicella lusitana]|uniref:Uncharacterized protein n=1 Tax=Aquicella lusitana TaxID=254246 RepID=A0A370GYU7_9COXI|nr:hypothetical protein C8D86_10188 [Aquicella lusitana]VVC73237.1 hypothetical protein AQULUS_09690 [Aquicella lusitana]